MIELLKNSKNQREKIQVGLYVVVEKYIESKQWYGQSFEWLYNWEEKEFNGLERKYEEIEWNWTPWDPVVLLLSHWLYTISMR